MAELCSGEECDGADDRQFRERRASEILTRYKKVRSHLSSVRSLLHDRRDSSRVKEWAYDVDLACRRARSKSGVNNSNTLVESLTARTPNYGAQFDVMLDSFLNEMDRLNRLGTPDDYDDVWGTDAAEQRERERVANYVRSAVRFAEATI